MDNMVVCPEPPAAKVGQEIFAAGGNAMDAAVAAAFAQGVTNPLLCGIGGTGMMYFYDARTGEDHVLNCGVEIGSRSIPESWQNEFMGRSETVGRYVLKSEANQIGYQSIMTPGFVRGCWNAFQRFGSGALSWAELLAPSIMLARDGFEVYPYIGAFWRSGIGGDVGDAKPGYPGLMEKLEASPEAWRTYLRPDGSPYEVGDWFKQPTLANTIERLAEAGGDDFYEGEIAHAIALDLEEHEGFITNDDLKNYTVDERTPLRGRYKDWEIRSTPGSSGSQIIQMLHMLEQFDLQGLGHNSAEYIDVFARIQRASFADTVRLKGMDPAETDSIEKEVIDPERAKSWAQRIKNGDRIEVRGGSVDTGTTHVTVMDSDRNVVTFTHSIGSLAGSGVITPSLGFMYNNFLGHYNPLPGHPDSIVPGKKLGAGLPTIVFGDGEPHLAVGAPGGSRIITSVTQSVANVLAHQMDMHQAVSLPRFHSEEEQLVFLEPAFDEATAQDLREMGNEVERSTYMSRVQAIRVRPDDGLLEAGADHRGGQGVGRHP